MFSSPAVSLYDLLGAEYTNSLVEALDALDIMDRQQSMKIVSSKIGLYPHEEQEHCDILLDSVGKQIINANLSSIDGAPTESFRRASNLDASPIVGSSCYRVGEDGRLYLIGKSEHYHASLGHSFPGFKLIEYAGRLGIPNATHNNTRGYITRLVERAVIAEVNGVSTGDPKLEEILASKQPRVLNRVINLETGSLAVEAGIKMMLTRFYNYESNSVQPKYHGRTPVFFVMADENGGPEANYHGTTILAQTLRGLWPEIYSKIDLGNIYKIVSVKPNNINDFREKLNIYNVGNYKVAGFLHEMVLMNYGGVILDKEFISAAYELCHKTDTPVLVDEIQSCMWYDGIFLFKLYGLQPDFVVIGKGFSGGNYAASKIIISAEMDSLNQFGALVTNGQEELASLAYLITMYFCSENHAEISRLGDYFENSIRAIAKEFPEIISRVEGKGHLIAMHFQNHDIASSVVKLLNSQCIDISAQLYKKQSPPAVLLKPPVCSTEKVLGYIACMLKEAVYIHSTKG